MTDIEVIRAKIESIRDKALQHKALREERSALIASLGQTEKDWFSFDTADEIRDHLEKTDTSPNHGDEIHGENKGESKE
jgi:hypothetical protein